MRSFDDLREAGLWFTIIRSSWGFRLKVVLLWRGPSRRRKSIIIRAPRARTIAHAISNPAPAAGNLVLKWIRERDGLILAVSDREMLAAQKLLAQEEGIFCQPESATTLAALLKFGDRMSLKKRGPDRPHHHRKRSQVSEAAGIKKFRILQTDLDNLEDKITALNGKE